MPCPVSNCFRLAMRISPFSFIVFQADWPLKLLKNCFGFSGSDLSTVPRARYPTAHVPQSLDGGKQAPRQAATTQQAATQVGFVLKHSSSVATG